MLIPIPNPPKNKRKTAVLNIEKIFRNRYKRPMFFHNCHTIFNRIADFELKKRFAELPKDKDGVLFTFNGKSNDLKIKFITNKQSILNDK